MRSFSSDAESASLQRVCSLCSLQADLNKSLLVAAAIGTRPNDKDRVRALAAAGCLAWLGLGIWEYRNVVGVMRGHF